MSSKQKTSTAAVVPVENVKGTAPDRAGEASRNADEDEDVSEQRTFPYYGMLFSTLILIALNIFAVATCKYLSWDGSLSWSWDNYEYDWFVPAPHLEELHQTGINGLFRTCDRTVNNAKWSNIYFQNGGSHLVEPAEGLPGDSGPKTAAQITGIAAVVFGCFITTYTCLKTVQVRGEPVILLQDRGDRVMLSSTCALAAILSFLTLLVFASEGCYDKDCEPKRLCSEDAPPGTYCYSKCHVSAGASISIVAGTLWLILGFTFALWNRKHHFKPKDHFYTTEPAATAVANTDAIKLVHPNVMGYHSTKWKNYQILADCQQAQGHVSGKIQSSDTYVYCSICGSIFEATNKTLGSHNRFHVDEEIC